VNHVQEVAKSIVKAMDDPLPDFAPASDRMIVADTYKKFAIMDYANALRFSGERTEEHNQRCIEEAYVHYYKAISLGIPEERLEAVFAGLRSYWSNKLAGVKQ
jgi:hypothetical protein